MKTNNPQVGQQHIITHILLVIAIIFIFTNYVFGQAETGNKRFNINNTGITPPNKVKALQPFGLEYSLMINFITPVKNSTIVQGANDLKKFESQ